MTNHTNDFKISIKRNTTSTIKSSYWMLAICKYPCDDYEQMKYYRIVSLNDVKALSDSMIGCNEGYFVYHPSRGKYDYFERDEFFRFFMVVETCHENKKIDEALKFLRNVRKIDIHVIPVVESEGYFYRYSVKVYYPFLVSDFTQNNFDTYEEAAKKGISEARKICLKRHGKDGLSKWLEYAFGKNLKKLK